MNIIRIKLLVLLLGFSVFVRAEDKLVIGLVEKAGGFKLCHKDFEAIKTYQQVLKIDSLNFEALWNVSNLYARVGWLDNMRKRETAITYFKKAKHYGSVLYRHYPNTYEANVVMSGTIARLTEFSSAKEKVQSAWDIKKYADIAQQLGPQHHEVWYLLSHWNFEISRAGWLEKTAAKIFLGGLPKEASYHEAITYMKKAVKMNPGYTVYLHDLATFYFKTNDYKEAIEYCKKALALKPDVPEEIIYVDMITELLKAAKEKAE